jgi:molybdopterin-biosynthesis enzyme MoeA-like protein
MDGVAAAFGRDLEASDEALHWLETEGGYASEDLTEGTTDIPAGGDFIRNPNGVAPGCAIGNVYVLPGVPDEMKGMFEVIADEFDGTQVHVATVEADEPESALIDRLIDVQESFDVTVGSYPGETVRLKISGESEDSVGEARDWLAARVDQPE